eukprot:169840_1
MNIVLFSALSFLLHVTHADPCDEQLPFQNGGVCLPIGDLCCACVGSGCEGCETVACSTTAEPTTTFVTTDAPETTTEIGTTLTGNPCICTTESFPECPPSTDDSFDDDACDCSGGMVELRFNYTGAATNVEISLYDEDDMSQAICTFTDVNPDDEIICNVNDASIGLSKFAKNTRFTITRNDDTTCAATYHTSCSKNIVGVVMDECDELVASGWRDGDGDNCDALYVDTDSSKPGSKSGSGSSDGNDDECDCSGGMVELRFNYTGTATNVEISLYDEKDMSQAICTFTDVNPEDEIICNVNDASIGLSKFAHNTRFRITRDDDTTCAATYHTSCSKNIVGVVMDECDELVASGWRDGDGDNCDALYVDTGSSKPGSKSGSGSRDGNDDECDCSGGVVELRFNYTGTATNVDVHLYDEKDQSRAICTFTDVNPDDEIVCNVNGASPPLITTGLSKFGTNTRFRIERNDGSRCAATYHTSCSQNIVGVVQDECDELVVSGWRDGDGSNCDRDAAAESDDPCKSGSRSKSRSSRHRMVRRLALTGRRRMKGSKSASGSKKGSKSASRSKDASPTTTTVFDVTEDEECLCASYSQSSSSSSESKASSGSKKKKGSKSASTGSVSHHKRKESVSASFDGATKIKSKGKSSGQTYSSGMDAPCDDDVQMSVNGGESLNNGGDMVTNGGVRYGVMCTWMMAVFGACLFVMY